jgi:Ribbon-helix-helix protein, copG family
MSPKSPGEARSVASKGVTESSLPTIQEALEEMARDTGRPVSELLREAIALERRANEVWERGGRVVVEENGERSEVRFR